MKFLIGDIIRNKKNGIAYLICNVNNVCLLVVDLRDKTDPAMLYAIMPRDYQFYARDLDMNFYHVKRYTYFILSQLKYVYIKNMIKLKLL